MAESQMIDLNGAGAIQVVVDDRNGTVWVNVDGICRLRSQGHLVLDVDYPIPVNGRIDPEFLEEEVRDSILQQLGYKEGHAVEPYLNLIRGMTVYEAFDRYLLWHGMINSTNQIITALNSCISSSMTVSSEETFKSDTNG